MRGTLPMPVKVRPYRHQQAAFDFVCRLFGLLPSGVRSRGAALLMEMGCGKTLTAIGIAGILYQIGLVNRVLVAEVDAELEKLQKELLKKADAKQAFDSIADRIDALRDKKRELLLEDAANEGVMKRVRELEEFIDSRDGAVTEYDEALVRRLIEKVTVYDDRFAVEFKSGFETDVMM